jgi:hypothetical protein
VRRTFEQGKNLLLQSSGLTEEAYGILKCVARYPAELVRFGFTVVNEHTLNLLEISSGFFIPLFSRIKISWHG